MKRVSSTATGSLSPSARVVDGTLVLSLPDALTPIVWRLDLGQTKASALEVRVHDNGNHVLVLRTPKGEIHEIAPYETRAGAVQALMAVSQALESGHGQMRAATPAGANDIPMAPVAPGSFASGMARPSRGTGRTLLLTIAGVVAIVAVLSAVSHIGARHVPSSAIAGADQPCDLAAAQGAATAAPASGTPAVPTTGVPMSADQFLQQSQSGQ
jgi:hypothetical protein